MPTVKIKFTSNRMDAKGFYELMKNTRVLCLPGDVYQIPKSALKLLHDKGLKYEVIAEEGIDSAYKTLRNTAASKV